MITIIIIFYTLSAVLSSDDVNAMNNAAWLCVIVYSTAIEFVFPPAGVAHLFVPSLPVHIVSHK